MFSFLKSSYEKIKRALSKSSSYLGGRLKDFFSRPWKERNLDELEQILYEADLGTACTEEFVTLTRECLKKDPEASLDHILSVLSTKAKEILLSAGSRGGMNLERPSPLVILVVGVNGSGKTTSIAKLGHLLQKEGKEVLLVAADTFRAAAIEQLELWAKKLQLDIVKGKSGGDPSAVVFDGLSAAKARSKDIVLIDTAGRLQNKTDLMEELKKIRKTCAKVIPEAPHETLLVLDATTGQNALDQASIFNSFTPLSAILLTKLDGSAKGGIVLSIAKELNIPVQFVGVGEHEDDLMAFNAQNYVAALFGLHDASI